MSKTDITTIKRGLRRVTTALVTAVIFMLALFGFVVVALIPGYLAVLLFLVSVVALGIAFILLYAQGIGPKTYTESKGGKK